jgi:hypothetical protein
MTLTRFPNGLQVGGYAAPDSATFSAGTETAGDAITVAIQLLDGAGDALTQQAAVMFYLSDDSGGDGAVAATQELASGTDGDYIELVADSVGVLVSEADGTIDLTITGHDTDAETYYIVLIMPSGELVVSDAIVFAAD